MNPDPSTDAARRFYANAMESTPSSPSSDDWNPLPWRDVAAVIARSHPQYRINGFIGNGGMGSVYHATDDREGELFPSVAIKFIRHDLKNDKEYLGRFEKEITALQKISAHAGDNPTPHHHGNIRILTHGVTADGVPFLVMPFLHGETLSQLLEKPRFDQPRALRLMAKICAAVAYAHENCIVHGDLKPPNIHLIPGADGELQPVIIDYGLSRTRHSSVDRPTIPGQYHGTAGYTAPEVIRGHAAGYPADVFALGKICIQLINGNDERVSIPALLQPVILKATSDTIGLRYQTASEFSDAIDSTSAMERNSEKKDTNESSRIRKYNIGLLTTCGIIGSIAIFGYLLIKQETPSITSEPSELLSYNERTSVVRIERLESELSSLKIKASSIKQEIRENEIEKLQSISQNKDIIASKKAIQDAKKYTGKESNFLQQIVAGGVIGYEAGTLIEKSERISKFEAEQEKCQKVDTLLQAELNEIEKEISDVSSSIHDEKMKGSNSK